MDRDLPIILCSAYGEFKLDFATWASDAYVVKSADLTELKSTIRRFLERKMNVKKAVIPAAGFGTRFLPATKVVPKELLPIVDKPTIQYIMEEVVAAGIDQVILITGREKGSIEDHFDTSSELENHLKKKGREDLLKIVRDIAEMVTLVSVRQKEPLGLGHAILCAKRVIQNEPFAVLLGDDLIDAPTPCMKQMIDVYGSWGRELKTSGGLALIAIQKVPRSETHLIRHH